MRHRVLLAVALGGIVCCGRDHAGDLAPLHSTPAIDGVAATPDDEGQESSPPKPRKLPTGAPSRVSCKAMRTLLDDVTAHLAAPAIMPAADDTVVASQLADGVIEWADPHGLWTASPDSPVSKVLRTHAVALRAALDGSADCANELRPIGESLVAWTAELRREYDAGTASAKKEMSLDAAASDAMFDSGVVAPSAKKLARELGRRAGVASLRLPSIGAELAAARDRWLPPLDAQAWGEVILAAAVRTYVPLLDPHGAWAPAEEASTLYDRDLELAPPPRIWEEAARTAIGVRIMAGGTKPLLEGDVVLSVDSVSLVGLSVEAIDQLAEAADGAEAQPRTVRVLRSGRLLTLDVRTDGGDEPAEMLALASEEIPFGSGHVVVIHVEDVPDALGDDLGRSIASARERAIEGDELLGVLIDLRGNGGGSIEGADTAVGVFLPGVPLFPLKSRDGAIETERSAEPPAEDRWSGPVATLVDGGTASAAEMIAGALRAYRRGAILGAGTYGKGCAQEYLDDAAGTGVLRMTTLLYALPDGTPVQRVGLHPDIALTLPQPHDVKDREADLPRAPPTWSGPDVRDSARIAEVPWPTAGRVGPCKDEAICRALLAVGAKSHDVAKR